MTALYDVSPKAQEICEQEGWDDQTLILHLLGFILKDTLPHSDYARERAEIGSKLETYFVEIAAEERGSA